jgi:hypothetical protein
LLAVAAALLAKRSLYIDDVPTSLEKSLNAQAQTASTPAPESE